ncbi:MAG TPA: hypothetical protein VIV11_26135, partial [Kofleriaceae bacterium]
MVQAAAVCLLFLGCAGAPTGGSAAPDAAGGEPDVGDQPDAALPRGTFRNPLNAGPDPFLTFYAGHYYLATTQGDAVRMWKAASLAELAVAPATTIWQDTNASRNQ